MNTLGLVVVCMGLLLLLIVAFTLAMIRMKQTQGRETKEFPVANSIAAGAPVGTVTDLPPGTPTLPTVAITLEEPEDIDLEEEVPWYRKAVGIKSSDAPPSPAPWYRKAVGLGNRRGSTRPGNRLRDSDSGEGGPPGTHCNMTILQLDQRPTLSRSSFTLPFLRLCWIPAYSPMIEHSPSRVSMHPASSCLVMYIYISFPINEYGPAKST